MKKIYFLLMLSAISDCCINFASAQNSCPNVAWNMPATASSSYANETPNRAFDGDLTTNWSASSHTGWIKVDLQNKVTIDSIKLYVNQYNTGNTVHEIKVSEDMINWTLVRTLSGITTNNQLITVKFDPVLANVQGVMINTPSSNSWVAWFEIEIYSGSGSNTYKPSVSQDELVLTSSSETNNQWYLDGNPITDAKSKTYTATVSGSYQVGVSNGRGCIAMSDAVSISTITTGLSKYKDKDVRVYPNPTKDNIIITGISKAKIEIFNFQGQAVKLIDISETNTSVDISGLASGVYSLRITTKEGIFVKKLFKQ